MNCREIGVLTANKVSTRQYKIVAPTNPEKPIKYVRKPIDYSLLDDIGHSFITPAQRQKNRGSSQGSIQAVQQNASVPPPTTKPPTPPQGAVRMSAAMSGTGTLGKNMSNTGTLGKSNREYRTPPIIPPQVPSHYAPNYPIGHPRRASGMERGPGYSSLPMQQQMQQIQQINVMPQVQPQVQINMVHPMPQQQQQIIVQQQNPSLIQHTLQPTPTTQYEERHSMPRKFKIIALKI